MKTITEEFYASFPGEIDLTVKPPFKNEGELVNSMRSSLKDIANAKHGVKGGQKMEIVWNVAGKCYKEIVIT